MNVNFTDEILQHPESWLGPANAEADFTCVVSCDHDVYWRIGSANFRGIEYLPSGLLRRLQSSGIEARSVKYESCEDADRRTETIRIRASEDLDGVAVQCKARSARGRSSNYSAYLHKGYRFPSWLLSQLRLLRLLAMGTVKVS